MSHLLKNHAWTGLTDKYTGVIKKGNNIPLITSETYGTFRISYLDNDTNEKSCITITKSRSAWVVSGSGNNEDQLVCDGDEDHSESVG